MMERVRERKREREREKEKEMERDGDREREERPNVKSWSMCCCNLLIELVLRDYQSGDVKMRD
jgi:hypothetical protein